MDPVTWNIVALIVSMVLVSVMLVERYDEQIPEPIPQEPLSDPGPSVDPTAGPSVDPTVDPTTGPSVDPTVDPTTGPSVETIGPTRDPTFPWTPPPGWDVTGTPPVGWRIKMPDIFMTKQPTNPKPKRPIRPKPIRPKPIKPKPVQQPAAPVPQAPAPHPPGDSTVRRAGPHTGEVRVALPILDLEKKDAGLWRGRVKWNKSKITTFEGEPVVRVFYKKDSGTSRHPFGDASGCSLSSAHPALAGQTAAVVAFDVYFDPEHWEWSTGGKLGGIFIGHGKAAGYQHSPDGASHRIMWQRDGGAISYIYPPSGLPQEDPKLRAAGHGIGYFGDVFKAGTLKKGMWNHVEIGVKLNTFDSTGKPRADGKAQLTVNGVSGLLDNIRWSSKPSMKISSFNYGTFFGGPGPAIVDSVSYVKNFVVHAWKDSQ